MMNKRKLISVAIALLGLFFVGMSILLFLGAFKQQNAGILVEANVLSNVYINGEEVGKTPFEVEREPGEINLRIKPSEVSNSNLDDYETKLNLISGIKTIVKRDFNENDDYVSSAVVSFEKMGGQESLVTVATIPDNAQVMIDDKLYGYAPIKINIPAGDHELRLISEGYTEKSLSIKVYKGFKLTAAVKLSKVLETEVTEEDQKVVEVKKEQIRIDKNSVGFLRVRSGASTGFPEVGQVKPDEVYDILEEGEHGKWFKIKFGEIEGWVSGEFVTKL